MSAITHEHLKNIPECCHFSGYGEGNFAIVKKALTGREKALGTTHVVRVQYLYMLYVMSRNLKGTFHDNHVTCERSLSRLYVARFA